MPLTRPAADGGSCEAGSLLLYISEIMEKKAQIMDQTAKAGLRPLQKQILYDNVPFRPCKKIIQFFGGHGIDWLGNPDIALYSVIMTDVWKGVSIATVIYIAGITSIDKNYYEAASIDGANGWQRLKSITIPLCRPAMNSVIILSFIGGLRSFDLIWAMTNGGPGFATDVMASIVYKQYAAGFYGLSTAGNVIMFVLIALLGFPLQKFLLSKEVD